MLLVWYHLGYSIPAQCGFAKRLLDYRLHHHLGIIAETIFFNQVWESIVRVIGVIVVYLGCDTPNTSDYESKG